MIETTGKIPYVVGADTFYTWYKVVGDLKSGVRPLVALHGGPGIAHQYMLPHAELYENHGIPIVLYDQVGIGESTHLSDKPKELLTVGLFINELENLLTHLGIIDNFDVVGHSWGGMLALSYVCARHPPGLKRIVLVSSPASIHLWQIGTRALLEGLPEDVRETLKKHEREGTTDHPEYQKGMEVFFFKHICQINPPPEELRIAKAAEVADPYVYANMNGPSEFYITGIIRTWSVIDDLPTITQPTLIINGAFDEAQDVCIAPLFERISKAKWVQLSKSSHMPFFEEKDKYLKLVSSFLTGTSPL